MENIIPNELSWSSLLLISLILLLFVIWKRTRSKLHDLPPGPPGFPIVGNLFQLGKRPHESLYSLSLKYGPLMTLQLGMKTTVVVSSSVMAKNVLKTHDHIFAGRTVIEGVKSISHHKSSLIFADLGAQWRHLRRISTVELFSNTRQEALQHLRRKEVFHTIGLIYEDKGNVVDVGKTVFCTSLNLLGNIIFSTRVFDPDNPASVGFNHSVCELMRLGGKPNLVDFFPFLRLLDPQGVCTQMAKHFQVMYDFVDIFLQKRLASESHESSRQKENNSMKDYLGVLLDLRSEDFTPADIRALIAELFIAGTETTTSTVEWGMAEFIRNPDKLKRVREELDEVVGCNRRVEESDLDSLPYLQAGVKEIFRLHTPVPLLLPHKAESSCTVEGFVIPKDTQVLVNVWAIAKDPSVWHTPFQFIPERFLEGENSKVDFKGQNFELIPFGAGRRICAGLPLASRMVHLILASLLHSFEWVLPGGMSHEEVDMSDELGITLKKSAQLTAIPQPRLSHQAYQSGPVL